MSADELALVPLGVVTVTTTVPVPLGDVTEMDVELITFKLVPGIEPKSTVVAPVKPDPVITIWEPPLIGP